jgi:hypothetical protein
MCGGNENEQKMKYIPRPFMSQNCSGEIAKVILLDRHTDRHIDISPLLYYSNIVILSLLYRSSLVPCPKWMTVPVAL